MATIFGPEWNDLALSDVERWLEDADAEPLLWEAKGTKLDPHDMRKAACAFGNGNETGYLILGADETADGWKLNGYDFKDEPPAWVARIVQAGVRPYPVLDVRSWPLSSGGSVAVVRIEPVATPPCNSRGTVYERISGNSVPVKDPTRLADLYARGRSAHERAQASADMLTEAIVDLSRTDAFPQRADEHGPIPSRFALALCPTGGPEDVAGRLFTESYLAAVLEAIPHYLTGPGGNPADLHWLAGAPEHTQDSVVVLATRPDLLGGARAWSVRIHWSGTVAIHYITPHRPAPIDKVVDGAVRAAWTCGAHLVRQLHGYGPAYMSLWLKGGDGTTNKWGGALDVRVRQGPVELEASDRMLDRVKRELERAAGHTSFEPEDKPSEPAGDTPASS